MVDAHDSKSCSVRSVGSSPTSGTKMEMTLLIFLSRPPVLLKKQAKLSIVYLNIGTLDIDKSDRPCTI